MVYSLRLPLGYSRTFEGGFTVDILGLLKELFSGVLYLFTAEGLKTLVMFVISGVLIYLAIKKDYEPALLLPIGFGAILANLPPVIDQVTGSATASVLGSEGFLTVLFNAGIKNELFPVLIFIAVGAMIDFSPLLKSKLFSFHSSNNILVKFLKILVKSMSIIFCRILTKKNK